MHFHSSILYDTGQSLLMDFGLSASTLLVFFDIGQALLVDFGLCASTRLVFFNIGFCSSKNLHYFLYCRSKDLQLYVL